MSSRERWIIYPLLFFTFCLAARDQLPYLRPRVVEIPRLSCKVIDAKWIDSEIVTAVNLTGDTIESKKRFRADTATVNDLDTGVLQCEQLVAKSPENRRLAELDSTSTGAGRLTLFGSDEQAALVLPPDEDQQEPPDEEPNEASDVREEPEEPDQNPAESQAPPT